MIQINHTDKQMKQEKQNKEKRKLANTHVYMIDVIVDTNKILNILKANYDKIFLHFQKTITNINH